MNSVEIWLSLFNGNLLGDRVRALFGHTDWQGYNHILPPGVSASVHMNGHTVPEFAYVHSHKTLHEWLTTHRPSLVPVYEQADAIRRLRGGGLR